MKIYIKLPGEGEIRFERESGSGEGLAALVLLASIAFLFGVIWILR